MKTLLFAVVFGAVALHSQPSYEGLWQGYDGEWGHVSRQLIALAEAIPAEKYSWRPAPGVRSVSEVYMHIALANFSLLSVTGPKMPAGVKADLEKTVTSKQEVIDWLKRSLEAVKKAHSTVTAADLQRKVRINGRDATVDGMYLRIIVHANEHMGQLVAYARMNASCRPGPRSVRFRTRRSAGRWARRRGLHSALREDRSLPVRWLRPRAADNRAQRPSSRRG